MEMCCGCNKIDLYGLRTEPAFFDFRSSSLTSWPKLNEKIF